MLPDLPDCELGRLKNRSRLDPGWSSRPLSSGIGGSFADAHVRLRSESLLRVGAATLCLILWRKERLATSSLRSTRCLRQATVLRGARQPCRCDLRSSHLPFRKEGSSRRVVDVTFRHNTRRGGTVIPVRVEQFFTDRCLMDIRSPRSSTRRSCASTLALALYIVWEGGEDSRTWIPMKLGRT